MQKTVPFDFQKVIPIGHSSYSYSYSYICQDAFVTYFYGQQPYDFHKEGDGKARNLRIANLMASNGVLMRDLEEAFDLSPSTIHLPAKGQTPGASVEGLLWTTQKPWSQRDH